MVRDPSQTQLKLICCEEDGHIFTQIGTDLVLKFQFMMPETTQEINGFHDPEKWWKEKEESNKKAQEELAKHVK